MKLETVKGAETEGAAGHSEKGAKPDNVVDADFEEVKDEKK